MEVLPEPVRPTKKNKDDNIHKSEALKSEGRTNEHCQLKIVRTY